VLRVALVRLRVWEHSRPRVTDDVLSPSGLSRVDLAEVRPQPLGPLAEPRRLVAELDHVQNESIDPRGLVHDSAGERTSKLQGLSVLACVRFSHLGDHGAAPDRNVRALKQVRQVNLKPQNTPPLCSRRRLHLWQVSSGD